MTQIQRGHDTLNFHNVSALTKPHIKRLLFTPFHLIMQLLITRQTKPLVQNSCRFGAELQRTNPNSHLANIPWVNRESCSPCRHLLDLAGVEGKPCNARNGKLLLEQNINPWNIINQQQFMHICMHNMLFMPFCAYKILYKPRRSWSCSSFSSKGGFSSSIFFCISSMMTLYGIFSRFRARVTFCMVFGLTRMSMDDWFPPQVEMTARIPNIFRWSHKLSL